MTDAVTKVLKAVRDGRITVPEGATTFRFEDGLLLWCDDYCDLVRHATTEEMEQVQ